MKIRAARAGVQSGVSGALNPIQPSLSAHLADSNYECQWIFSKNHPKWIFHYLLCLRVLRILIMLITIIFQPSVPDNKR
jgi:hypothetical protein